MKISSSKETVDMIEEVHAILFLVIIGLLYDKLVMS